MKKEDFPSEVIKDLENGFILTGDRGLQRFKKLANGHYEFKTGYEGYYKSVDGNKFEVGLSEGDVKFSNLTEDEIKSSISGYYDSIEELKQECDGVQEDFEFLVCECYYEQFVEE
ncbi:hypothetical protein [Alteromonas macleodii]|uniref:hypothetical protein n=1 Tax=Alteromonas macleodii TaxID=28108 RepID=UPI003140C7E0